MSAEKDRLLAQAREKDALARRFDSWHEQLTDLLDHLEAEPGTWKGPAADRYNAALKGEGRTVDGLAGSCQTTAANLRKSAQRLRDQAKDLPD